MRDLRNGHFILFDDYDENYKKEDREREREEEVKKCQIEINSTKKFRVIFTFFQIVWMDIKKCV